MERIDFQIRRETPTLDHYRRAWTPGPGVGLAGMWIGVAVSDASGQTYIGLRGADDYVPGIVHTVAPVCGFRSLHPGATDFPPHLFAEYSTVDWFEPFQFADEGDRVKITYDTGRIERDADGCHWYDASGRWEMHGKTVSDVVTIHVPKQEGVSEPVYYRHELMHAKGRIGDIEVSGYMHQDYAHSLPGMIFPETAIPRRLQGMWVSWLHEYSDGEVGGGCFWQGRNGLPFGPGYQLKNGETTVHKDIVATPTFDGQKLVALEAAVGGDTYSFVFDKVANPLHFYGQLVKSSSGKTPVRSWCWVENSGAMMTPEILDWGMQRYRLARGK